MYEYKLCPKCGEYKVYDAEAPFPKPEGIGLKFKWCYSCDWNSYDNKGENKVTQDSKPDPMGAIAKAHKDFYDAFLKVGFKEVQALSLTMNLINEMMRKAPAVGKNSDFWEKLRANGSSLS